MTFETLLAELRAGNVPNATQNEILLALAEAINTKKDKPAFEEEPLGDGTGG